MANNQITPTFLNFANNVSLSQNKWNDTRLHQNKGCYYNNLLSPFWKRKESFTGIPYEIGNNVYKIDNNRLLKNNIEILSDIPDGYTYDILSYEVLNVFSNYNGEQNYRFYKTLNNEIQLDYNDTVITLNIPGDSVKYKIIQIPTKTGYQASFGILTILKTNNKITAKFYEVHFSDINNITIESTQNVVTAFDEYTEYVITGGLIYNGTWAGFSLFPNEGWIMHDKDPVNFLVNLNDLTQFKTLFWNDGSIGPGTAYNCRISYNGDHQEMNNIVYHTNLRTHQESSNIVLTSETKTVGSYAQGTPYLAQLHQHIYFCKYSENAFTINGTAIPSYGFELWIKNSESVYLLYIGNYINNIVYDSQGYGITIFYYDSLKVIYPYSEMTFTGQYGSNPVDNFIIEPNFQGSGYLYDEIHRNSYYWGEGVTFKIASSSFISEDFQENVYCGYFKTVTYNFAIPLISFYVGYVLSPSEKYFSFGYTCGTVKENMNVFSEKTFNNLNPGDNVYDPNPKLWKTPNNFYLAIGSEGTIQNVLTEHGCSLMQWQNTDRHIFGENGVIYGRFINNNQWFKIKKCAPYIVAQINTYLLINSDGLNAYNFDTDEMNKCWSIGYNGALEGNWSDTASYTELSEHSVLAMPSVKVYAGAVNNHPRTTEDYFTGVTYKFFSAYNFADYTVGANPFIYDIEFYKGSGTDPEYSLSIYAESSSTYTNTLLSGLSYLFSGVIYSWFLCNFSIEYFYNRFGIIDLGNNIKTNLRYIEEYVVTEYALNSLLEEIENIFIIQGQIYAIKRGYIYSLILASDFSISYQNPITECTNLKLIGNTSKYAIFFSPLTKAIYSFTGSQIFEYMQDASDIQSVITWKNNQYMNISLISYLNAENINKVLLIQNNYSSIIWENTDDLADMSEGNITKILIEKDNIYFVTSLQTVYSVMFYNNNNNYTKVRLEYESETLQNDFSQNIIDCIYINVLKKDLPSGKVWVSLISGSGETKQEFSLKEIPDDRNGLSLIRYQPKYQQRGRVAIRVESEVPLENIAYTVKPVGNEISHKHIEI